MRLIGPNGLALIKSFEKLRLVAFKPIPTDPWTIGWGRAHGVHEGDTCTPEQADEMLTEDLVWVESSVGHVTVVLGQNQYDALCSFCYNIGQSNFLGSTLLEVLNAGNYWQVPNEMRRWNKSTGVVSNGLINRRQAEIELWARHDDHVPV